MRQALALLCCPSTPARALRRRCQHRSERSARAVRRAAPPVTLPCRAICLACMPLPHVRCAGSLTPAMHSTSQSHSERVPNKNFRLLAGRPLYCWTLSALLGSSQIARVVIDTDADGEKLAQEIAAQFPKDVQRVTVLPRPQELRGDMVPMTSILFHDVSTLAADFFLQTHSTNPFLRTETVDQAVSAFISSQPAHDSLFSVVARRTRLYDQLGRAVNHNPAVLLRTQDLPPLYEENSSLYIFTASDLLRRHQRIGERPLLFEMSATESLDIDDEHDWDVAAAMMPSVLVSREVMPAALAAPPAEEAAGGVVQITPGRRCALVVAQRLRPLHGAAASSPTFDVLVSAPYLLPHMKRFTPIMAEFGLRAIVPPGLEERLSEEQLLAIAGSFDGAVTGDDAFTKAVFAACAPRLKCVAKWGTGIDSIDLDAAAAHGCAIRNTPEAFTCPVADSSVAYILAFARGIVANDASIKAGRWCKQPGVCLAESVVGIIGLGAVGRAVAQRCAAFSASVLAVDPVPPPPSFLEAHPEVKLGSLEQVISSSHFVVLCCDLNPGA